MNESILPVGLPVGLPAEASERLIELFDRARQLEPAERARFLAEACADAPQWRQEIESLLDYDDEAPVLNATSALKAAAHTLVETDLSGQVIDRYHILKPIGTGGMGRVYLAEDSSLGRQVALKFLPESFTAEPERVRRFEQEARATSTLNHPNIITVYETGQHERRHYITYEFVEGQTLRARLAGEPLRWQEAVVIGAQIAAALKAAHAAGIIHRDIKPENVMLRADGLVKVLDFGIAKRLDLREADSSTEGATAVVNATLAGQVFGTLGYLAPEQARGEKLDARADVFALGIVLYEMLAGHPWAEKSAAEKLEAVQSAEEIPLLMAARQDLPTALVALVTNAVKKDRAQRSQSISPMLDVLNELKPTNADQTDQDLQGAEASLRTQNANRLLNQFVSLYDTNRRTRLSPTAMWTIWRHSNLKRGKLEKRLLRQSLLSVLAKGCGVAGVAALLALLLAAWFSITETWDERVMHDGHAKRVVQVRLSPDGKKLISVSYDKKVIVWDLARRARSATLNEHTDHVSAAAFSPDGKWLATAGSDQRAIVWDAERLTKVVELLGPRGDDDKTIAFTPNGKLFVGVGDPDKKDTRNVWEVGTWRKLVSLRTNGDFLLSPDSRLLVNGNWQINDLLSGNEVVKGEGQPIGDGALSPDGTRLAGIDAGGFVSFWDVSRFWKTGERRLLNRFLAHRDHGHAIAYSPDGRLVASASENIILWDARTHEILARFTAKDTVNDVIFSHDSRQIISAHGDGAIIIWDIAEKAQVANLAEHGGPVYAASFSPDGQTVLSASEDNSVFIWDAASGLKRAVLTGHRSPVKSAEFSRDGQWAVTSDLSHNVKVWDAATGAHLRSFALPRKDETLFNYGAALLPDKRWVATTFGVYDTNDGRTVVQFSPQVGGYPPAIRGLAFSSDGRWLACAGTGGYIALWEVAQWRLRQELSVGGNFNTVTFTLDNHSLVIGDNDGQIQLWQIEPLKLISDVGSAASGIEGFSFSPDGRVLAAASDNETLSLWDVTGRRHLRDVGQHILPVLAVGFAPDGRRLVTGEQDSSVRVYTRQRSLWGWRLE